MRKQTRKEFRRKHSSSFFDDSYVSLLPGENKTMYLRVDEKLHRNKEIEMHLEGWNTKPGKFKINIFETKFE